MPVERIPELTRVMLQMLPAEDYDPDFAGQGLITTYLDTLKLELRRNRLRHDSYITLRVRCYRTDERESYALSAKTEEEKFRVDISPRTAAALLNGGNTLGVLAEHLPAHLFARLMDVAHGQVVGPAVSVYCRRYAREDEQDRLTLDVGVRTDTGKSLPYAVCEFKSTQESEPLPDKLRGLPLRPIKLSKFLWALEA